MTSQVFTIHGLTNPSLVGGVDKNGFDLASCAIAQISSALYLTSDLWSGFIDNATPTNNKLRIPKGCDFKIWENTVYGQIPVCCSCNGIQG